MSNFLYNGIELPALPTWDKSTYPVAVISEVLSAGQSMYAGAKYILALGKYVLWQGAKCYVMNITGVYRYDGSAWVWHYGSGTVSNQDIVAANYFEAVWTNTNIPTADGVSVYLPKSDPVPVGGESGGESGGEEEEPPTPEYTIADVIEARKRGFIAGFLTGINIRGTLRKRTIEEPLAPVAYLYGTPSPTVVTYNGVELPELPEWDKDTYPYAYINEDVSGAIEFICATKAFEHGTYLSGSTSLTNTHISVPAGTVEKRRKYTLSGNEWGSPADRTYDRTSSTTGYMGYFDNIFWANTDIPNVDNGTTYLAASEPVYSQVGGNLYLATADKWEMYNGAVLPPLPETKYPYIQIRYTKSGTYNLAYMEMAASYRFTTSVWNDNIVQLPQDGVSYMIEWYDGEAIPEQWGEPTALANVVNTTLSSITWASVDLYTAVGELYRATSEPIPLASSEPVYYIGDIPVYNYEGVNEMDILAMIKKAEPKILDLTQYAVYDGGGNAVGNLNLAVLQLFGTNGGTTDSISIDDSFWADASSEQILRIRIDATPLGMGSMKLELNGLSRVLVDNLGGVGQVAGEFTGEVNDIKMNLALIINTYFESGKRLAAVSLIIRPIA